MKVSTFFSRYANIPLGDRFKIIDVNKAGLKTLSDVYKEMIQLEDTMRPMRIRQQILLDLADIIMNKKEKLACEKHYRILIGKDKCVVCEKEFKKNKL